MKFRTTIPVVYEVNYLRAKVYPRFWQDATLNGKTVDEDNYDFPLRVKDMWDIVIDLDTGVILDWPQGTTARVNFKVCDMGLYSLLDVDKKSVRTIDECYVPTMLGGDDYVSLKIDENGTIHGWVPDLTEFGEDD